MIKQLYLNQKQFKSEINRCLNCRSQPCMKACPANCNPREFIQLAKEGSYQKAADSIFEQNPLGHTCGLICPDKFCMSACTRARLDFPINIPQIQSFILKKSRPTAISCFSNKHKVAVIGAGPAGIAAAYSLAQKGFKVTIFEASNRVGGALNLIPSFRLPKKVISEEWLSVSSNHLISLKLNYNIDNPSQLIRKGFEAVIVSSGEPHISKLGIEGEEFAVSYVEYLKNPRKFATHGKVAVIGGGLVAADCAMTAKNYGASSVTIFIRRRVADMRVSTKERDTLLANAVILSDLTGAKKITRSPENGMLTLFTAKNHLVDGKPQEVPNTTVENPGFSLIIKAIGSFAEKHEDTADIIYAGDCKTGSSTAVQAIASGKSAANKIITYLLG